MSYVGPHRASPAVFDPLGARAARLVGDEAARRYTATCSCGWQASRATAGLADEAASEHARVRNANREQRLELAHRMATPFTDDRVRDSLTLADDGGLDRPCVGRYRCRQGSLDVHVDLETGALHVFAHGPRGAQRGQLVVSPDAGRGVLERWLSDTRAENYEAGRSSAWHAFSGDTPVLNAKHVAGPWHRVAITTWRRSSPSWTGVLHDDAFRDFVGALETYLRPLEHLAETETGAGASSAASALDTRGGPRG